MENKITKQWTVQGIEKYEVTLKFLTESKIIYFIDCTCYDFSHKRLKSHLEFSDRTAHATPCKHIKPYVDFYCKTHGFKLKEPKKREGLEKPNAELKKALILRSQGMCESNCGKEGKHIHRKVRGSSGGKYSETNCVYLCPQCHRDIHKGEF